MRRLLEALDLATQDDGPQQDLAAALLEAYGAMRVAGVHEIPQPDQNGDAGEAAAAVTAEIRAQLDTILRDAHPGNTPKQQDAIPRLKRKARELRELLDQDPGEGTRCFSVLAELCAFAQNRIAKKSPSYDAFASIKNDLAPRLERAWVEARYADLHGLLRRAILRVDQKYRDRKTAEAGLDFSDLEEHAVRLLRSNERVRRRVQSRIDEVLMDELQDTNRLQWGLVRLICGEANSADADEPEDPSQRVGRLFAVGDINQSIYGFRHADPEVFAEYRQRLESTGAKIDELVENYRSRAEILSTVAAALDGQEGIEPRDLHARRKFTAPADKPVEVLKATGDDPNAVEGTVVARRIAELVDSGEFQFRQCAVLVRALAGADPILEAFDAAGIPYLVSGGRGFLETRECRDLLLLLAALVNPLDEVALYGVLRGPLFGIADRQLHAMEAKGWRRYFERELGDTRRLIGLVSPDKIVAEILDRTGFWDSAAGSRTRPNIDKFLGWLRREHHRRPRPLAELLESLEKMREAQNVAEAPPPDAGNVVNVMTVHAAKGLEYPVVFVSGLHRGMRNSLPAILFSPSPQPALGVKWRHPVTGKGVADAVYAALKDSGKTREEREADRLLYVAMTRAEDRLIVTYADRGGNPRGWVKLVTEAHPPDAEFTERVPIHPVWTEPEDSEAPEAPDTELLEPPKLSGQHEAVIAVTSVAEFAACPRRYFLGRYLRMDGDEGAFSESSPESGETAAAETGDAGGMGGVDLGSAVHRLLAGQELEETVDPGLAAEAGQLAERFRSSELGQQAARAVRSGREFEVLFPVADPDASDDAALDVLLRGQVDLWFENPPDDSGQPGELVLVDYKTDRTEASSESYALQLRLYALALERYLGRRPDRAVLHYLRQDRIREVPLEDDSLREARRIVVQMLTAQESLEFPLRTGDQCYRCAYRAGLCPFGRTDSGAETPGALEIFEGGVAEEGSAEGGVMPDLFWPPSFSQEPPKGGS